VLITNNPTSTGMTVGVVATGAGNALQRVTFGAIRNGVVDIPGVATGVGSGFSYTVPAGAAQTTFTVRAVDPARVVQVPFTVKDACQPDWRTFVGAGAGALQNPAVVCTSGETVLTEASAVGSTAFTVSNQGCFKVGDGITLDPGGPTEETLKVVGFGSVLTQAPAQQAHPAGTRARRYPGFDPDFCLNDPDCAGQGGTCCKPFTTTGRCCSAAQCCPDGCCTGVYKLCCRQSDDVSACIESSDPGDCCRLAGLCPSGSPAGSLCCDFRDGSGLKCHPPSDFQTNAANCGRCGNDCSGPFKHTDRCINGECRCGTGPACPNLDECIRGVCCTSPNVGCGPNANRICCSGTTSYCTEFNTPTEISSVCCLKTRVACNGACCQQGSVCTNNTTCTPCIGCVADRADVATNTCRCGSGPPCDTSLGQSCRNGTCACALVTNPGDKLCDLTCTGGTQLSGTVCPSNMVCVPYNDGSGNHFCGFGSGDPPLCTL
jgi:hypothetical protein